MGYVVGRGNPFSVLCLAHRGVALGRWAASLVSPVEELGVPGRIGGGRGWWKLPGTGLGVERRDTGVGPRLSPTLPQGSLYITRPA